MAASADGAGVRGIPRRVQVSRLVREERHDLYDAWVESLCVSRPELVAEMKLALAEDRPPYC